MDPHVMVRCPLEEGELVLQVRAEGDARTLLGFVYVPGYRPRRGARDEIQLLRKDRVVSVGRPQWPSGVFHFDPSVLADTYRVRCLLGPRSLEAQERVRIW